MKTSHLFAALTAAGLTAAANANIVINEVLGSTSGTDAEFIELFNTLDGPVDIGGWAIELWDSDAGASFGGADGGSPYLIPAGTMLMGGDHYLLANTTFSMFYSAVRDQAIPENAVENSSYTIILADNASSIVDSVFVTDGGAGDAANRMGAPLVPGASIGPDGMNLPAGFYRVGDGNPTLAFLEFNQPSPSATPGAANIPAPGAAALLAVGGLVAARRRRA